MKNMKRMNKSFLIKLKIKKFLLKRKQKQKRSLNVPLRSIPSLIMRGTGWDGPISIKACRKKP